MTGSVFTSLPQRSLIAVTGDDRKSFLHGLVSADIEKMAPGHALYGAFLTPQGRFLHEFFAAQHGDAILIETEAERRADFIKRLSIYKLRAKVAIAPRDDLAVYAILGEGAPVAVGLAAEAGAAQPFADGLVFVDPRLAAAGLRAWLPPTGRTALLRSGLDETTFAVWDERRIRLGLPDGSRDIAVDKSYLLEAGFDELHGVDWDKGCYLGQELTARTKYRGLVKKRLMPVTIEGPVPAPGTPLRLNGTDAGEMRSSSGAVGIALVRLDAFERIARDGSALDTGDARLTPTKPGWANF